MALRTQTVAPEGQDDASDHGIVAEINITPLTDIFLVLLIIFMVTSSVMSQLGVGVSLPKASHAVSESQPEGVIVRLMPAGVLAINGEQVPDQAFDQRLAAALTQAKAPLVVLEGDEKAFLGSAVAVMDRARKAGAKKFAIATALQEN